MIAPKSEPTPGDGPSRCALRALFAAVLLLAGLSFSSPPLAAQRPAANPPADAASPRFFIETISVEGTDRISEDILVSQGRLEEGREYSEAELADAVARIRRLPFVLDASPRLRRGSERGRFELVLEILETSRFFSSFNLFAGYEEPTTFMATPEQIERGFPETFERGGDFEFTSEGYELGYRFFTGVRGVAFVGVDSRLGLAAGYTRYRLFDTNAFLSVAVRHGLCCDSATIFLDRDDIVSGTRASEASVAIGIPLRPRHSLQVEAQVTDAEREIFVTTFPGDDDPSAPPVSQRTDLDSRSYGLGLRWILDTTDDPILPRTGSRMVGGISVGRAERRLLDSSLGDSDFVGAAFSARTHHALSRRTGWTLGFDATYTEATRAGAVLEEPETDTLSGSLSGGLYHTLRSPRPGARGGDLRLELAAAYSRSEASPEPSFRLEDDLLSVTAGLAYRNRFTVLRFGIVYWDGLR